MGLKNCDFLFVSMLISLFGICTEKAEHWAHLLVISALYCVRIWAEFLKVGRISCKKSLIRVCTAVEFQLWSTTGFSCLDLPGVWSGPGCVLNRVVDWYFIRNTCWYRKTDISNQTGGVTTDYERCHISRTVNNDHHFDTTLAPDQRDPNQPDGKTLWYYAITIRLGRI